MQKSSEGPLPEKGSTDLDKLMKILSPSNNEYFFQSPNVVLAFEKEKMVTSEIINEVLTARGTSAFNRLQSIMQNSLQDIEDTASSEDISNAMSKLGMMSHATRIMTEIIKANHSLKEMAVTWMQLDIHQALYVGGDLSRLAYDQVRLDCNKKGIHPTSEEIQRMLLEAKATFLAEMNERGWPVEGDDMNGENFAPILKELNEFVDKYKDDQLLQEDPDAIRQRVLEQLEALKGQ